MKNAHGRYDGTFKMGASSRIPQFLVKPDDKPGVKTENELVVCVYKIKGVTTWFIGEYAGNGQGYTPNSDNQPYVEILDGTDISPNSRFVLYLQDDDPTGTANKSTPIFDEFGAIN